MVRNFIIILLFIIPFGASAQVGVGGFFNKKNDEVKVDYANPRNYEIGGIEVTGTEFLDKNALISLAGLKVGDNIKIPGDEVTNAVKKLYGQGIIEDVLVTLTKIEDGKAFLNIKVKERPRLRAVIFKGVNKTQENDLSEKVDLIRGKVVTDALIKNTELGVRNHFVDKGYLNAEVKISQQSDTILRNSVNLLVEVDRKSKVRINKIYIDGNEELNDNKVKKKMKSTNEHVRVSIFQRYF